MNEPAYVTAARRALDFATKRWHSARTPDAAVALRAAEREFYRCADVAHAAKVRAATARIIPQARIIPLHRGSYTYTLLVIGTGVKTMNHPDRIDARRTQMLHELRSDLCNMVESGDMTDIQANEWYNMKADQWAQEG